MRVNICRQFATMQLHISIHIAQVITLHKVVHVHTPGLGIYVEPTPSPSLKGWGNGAADLGIYHAFSLVSLNVSIKVSPSF